MKQEERNISAAFYIPFAYLYSVRLRSITKLLSWLLLYILPTAFYSSMGYTGDAWSFAIQYTLVLIATFTLYETGYIFNDTLAIRREEHPSLRLNESETAYFFAHRWSIVLTRLLIAAICLCALSPIINYQLSIINYQLSIINYQLLMLVLFALYNRWRNRYNVFLYVWLVFSRFVPFMCLSEHGAFDYILLFVSYPMLIGMERFSMPSYRWGLMGKLIPDEPSKARFRAAYYCLALVILVPYCLCSGRTLYPLTPIAILAVYRILRLLNNKSI